MKALTGEKNKTALFFLSTSMIGIGYMTYPALCAKVGVGNLLIIYAFCGCVSAFYSSLIVEAYLSHRADSYPALAGRLLGARHRRALFGFLSLNVLASFIVQLSVVADLAVKLFGARLCVLARRPWIANATFGALAVGLSFSKLHKIRFLGYLGNFCSLSVGVLLFAQTAAKLYRTGESAEMRFFVFSGDIFSAIGACFFSFVMQTVLVPVIRVIAAESDYSHRSALLRAYYLPFALYSLIGVSGYALLGDAAPEIIAQKPRVGGALDACFAAARVGLFAALSLTISVKVLTLRDALRTLRADRGFDVGAAAALGALSVAASVAVDKRIARFASLISALLSPYIILICPTLMFARLQRGRPRAKAKVAAVWLLTVFVSFLLFCGAAKSLKAIFEALKAKFESEK